MNQVEFFEPGFAKEIQRRADGDDSGLSQSAEKLLATVLILSDQIKTLNGILSSVIPRSIASDIAYMMQPPNKHN